MENIVDNRLERLGLSEQALGCLENAGIKNLDDLSDLTYGKLRRICFMKEKIFDEIKNKARDVGIELAEYDKWKPSKFVYSRILKNYLVTSNNSKKLIFDIFGKYNKESRRNEKITLLEVTYLPNEVIYNLPDLGPDTDITKVEKNVEKSLIESRKDTIPKFLMKSYNYRGETRYKGYSFEMEQKRDDVLKEYAKKCANELDISDKLYVINKLEQNLGHCYGKEYSEFLWKFPDMTKKFLKDNFNDMTDEAFKELYSYYWYLTKSFIQRDFDRILEYLDNEIKRLQSSSVEREKDPNGDKIKQLQSYQNVWRNFSKKFMENNKGLGASETRKIVNSCFQETINKINTFVEDDGVGYYYDTEEGFDFRDEILREIDKNYKRKENINVSYEEVFNLFSDATIKIDFYDECNSIGNLNKLNEVKFVTKFIKVCKELAPNKNQEEYSKEILYFLVNKLQEYNNKVTNEIESPKARR